MQEARGKEGKPLILISPNPRYGKYGFCVYCADVIKSPEGEYVTIEYVYVALYPSCLKLTQAI